MKVSVVYDGLCPVCSHVTSAARLQDRASKLELIDARIQPISDVQQNDLTGVDLDSGFAVVVDGQVHLGAEAANVLAAITVPGSPGYRVFRWLVGSERRSRLFYPLLRFARNLLLRILRVPRFSQAPER